MSDQASPSSSLLRATADDLRRHAPFDQMDEESLLFFAGRARLGYYPKDAVVFSPEHGDADRLFVVKQGAIVGGRDKTEAKLQLSEGEGFPLGALLARRGVANTYRTAVDTFCYELGIEDFHVLVGKSEIFRDFCTRRIANLLVQSQKVIQAAYSRKIADEQPLDQELGGIMKPPVACPATTPLVEALATMRTTGIGSMLVVDGKGHPDGIFTLNDLLRVVVDGHDVQRPIAECMNKGLLTLPPDAPGHEAALLMARHGIRHVPVVVEGKLAGVVSERDLFSLQRVGLTRIGDSVRRAGDREELKQAVADIQQLAHNMLAQGVAPERLTQFVSTLNDLVTARLIELECGRRACPEVPFCWLAMGSEGRLEQTMATDQDNGIIFDAPEGKRDEVRREVLALAEAINQGLAELGFPLCKGGVMAGNPKWCLTLEEWKALFARWIDHGDQEALLHANIFFDFRPLYGKSELAASLREDLALRAQANSRFRMQMAANALRNRPPLGVVRDFVTGSHQGREHTLDLKINGTTPFVDGARILALAAGVSATNTAERLRQAAQILELNPVEVKAWVEAFYFMQLLRLRQQHLDRDAGREMTNLVDPDELNELDRRILKEAFRQARKLQSHLALEYQL